MNHRRILTVLCAAIVLWPLSTVADAGTPLVWATGFHLLVGNAIIGLLEGGLLSRAFGLPAGRCIGLLIIANYVSAWTGEMLMPHLFWRYATDIYSGLRVTWALIAGTYLLTLFVEWPFVASSFWKTSKWFVRSIKASLLIQSVSYVLLFGGYWAVSGKSLYTKMDVVSPQELSLPNGIVLFYISETNGDVYRADPEFLQDVKVMALGSTNHWAWAFLDLEESDTFTNYWDIVAHLVPEQGENQSVVVFPCVSTVGLVAEEQAWRTTKYGGWGREAFQIGAATNSNWKFGWAHWPDIGMWARNGSRTVRVAFGTPFGGWLAARVIHLPDDKALLQLGSHQICLVDVVNSKIALVRNGYGMLALSKDQIVEPSSAANPDKSGPIRSDTNRTSSAAGSR